MWLKYIIFSFLSQNWNLKTWRQNQWNKIGYRHPYYFKCFSFPLLPSTIIHSLPILFIKCSMLCVDDNDVLRSSFLINSSVVWTLCCFNHSKLGCYKIYSMFVISPISNDFNHILIIHYYYYYFGEASSSSLSFLEWCIGLAPFFHCSFIFSLTFHSLTHSHHNI